MPGWRSLLILRPARLHRARDALLVCQEEELRVPFEDIAAIVLDHPDILITHAVLAACGECGIALFTTGRTHQPVAALLPFLTHSRTTRLLRKQLALRRPQAKQAWTALVRAKIANQAACLRLAGRDGAERVRACLRRLRSGDPDNVEAQGAALYFPALFGPDFRRSGDDPRNAALDYGYAVLRGAICRSLVCHGLHPSLGLHHGSELNAYNLADDLIEPFRPIVDLHVAQSPPAGPLTPTDKAGLVALLHVDVAMPNGRMTVLDAIEQATERLARLYDGGAALHLPDLLPLRRHEVE